ncbi:monoglyceride lipase-like [Xenia sp. Carnegie-2017]|uniref:monoglyceride lipase-like n=1 Tax=Xenia sp. Carnegie-2017 TaxID=2897299 RepID=UPI001F03CB41|nr:monoglyceride lipase-like [Xenia sp. Carnegie-2017]
MDEGRNTNDNIIYTENGKELIFAEETARLKSDVDVYKWRLQPKNEKLRGILFFAHGYAEHSRCRDEFVRLLCAELNIIVISHDYVGHGRSKGERVYIDTFDTFVEDILCHVDEFNALHPDLPVYLFGHSMGGALTILTACSRPNFFKAVVLSSPAIVIDPSIEPGCVKVFVGRIINRLTPRFQILPKIDTNVLSKDPKEVEAYDSDPLIWHSGMKVRFAIAFGDALDRIKLLLPSIEWPFLVVHGDEDKITYKGGSELLAKEAKSKDKEIKIYKGLRHAMLGEVKEEADAVVEHILEWLRNRIPS